MGVNVKNKDTDTEQIGRHRMHIDHARHALVYMYIFPGLAGAMLSITVLAVFTRFGSWPINVWTILALVAEVGLLGVTLWRCWQAMGERGPFAVATPIAEELAVPASQELVVVRENPWITPDAVDLAGPKH